MKQKSRESEKTKADCIKCKCQTQHVILKDTSETGSTDYIDWYRFNHEILQCMGCQNVCFREVFWSSEDTDPEGRPLEEVTIYPNPTIRGPEIDVWKLPENVRGLYRETLTCYNSKAMTLSAAGLRSVVEATCIDQGCTSGNLKQKIECLINKDVLLRRDADYLHQHRFLGNEAVHELEAPPAEEFQIALRILEHLLTTVYVLPNLAADLVALRKKRGAQTQ